MSCCSSLEASWSPLGSFLGLSWGFIGASWSLLSGTRGFSCGLLGALLGTLGALLELSWGSLEALLVSLEACHWGVLLGSLGSSLEASWSSLGALLGLSWGFLSVSTATRVLPLGPFVDLFRPLVVLWDLFWAFACAHLALPANL